MAGCTDDTVGNPFNATEGSSSGGPTDTGGDDPAVITTQDGSSTGEPGTGTGMGTTAAGDDTGSSGGSTMAIAESGDESSEGSGPGSTGDASTGDGESSSSGEPPPNYEPCPEGMLPSAPLPSTVNGSSAGEDSEFSSTCGGGGAPDVAWLFTAPADGDYTFDTMGSSVDTVLHVRDGQCTGPEMQCDDDGIVNTTQSMMSVSLVQDQTVTVVVDSFGLTGGNVQLTVREGSVSCPTDIGSTVPQTVSGQTQVATDEFTGSCSTGPAADQGYLFTPPVAGTYTFEITNNTFDTLLYLLDGECAGAELACNDNLVGSVSGASGLALGLPAGEPVTVVVDGAFGGTGTFDLNIGMLAGTCPDDDLGSMVPPFTVNGTTTGEDNATTGTCGGLASNDFAYTWTAPASATYRFDTAGSAFDTVVYVLDGSCTGAELACSNDTGMSTAGNAAEQLQAGQTVVVVVDGNGEEGDFSLTITEATDSGNCCVTHGTPGCDDPAVEACVCAGDSFCCSVSWDGLCQGAAINNCNAICP